MNVVTWISPGKGSPEEIIQAFAKKASIIT